MSIAILGAGRVTTLAAAAEAADIVVLTTSWAGAQDALRAAGDLAGKVLVDATNPIGPGMVLTHGRDDSGAEQVARWAPGARVIEPAALLWITASGVLGTREFAWGRLVR